jgi:PAS domain S-box-containing protein
MRLIAQGEGFSEMESLRTGPGGRPQWVIIRKAVLRRADGTVVGLIGTNTDITYLKRIESELADRAKFVSELVDALPISVAMRDPEGRYVLVNRTWERYFGVRREEALGRRRRELPGWQSDPARRQDADEIERLDREILGRGPDYVAEPQQTLRLGRHYLITRRAMFDSGGRPIGVLSAGLDVTERRAMEQALALERERLAMLVRSTKAGFSDWDAVRDVVTYSDRYKEMLGYPPDADTSAWPSIFERMHPEDREAARDTFRAMIRRRSRPGLQEPGAPMEYRLRRADGSYIWVHAEGIADVDESGRTRRFITSVIDVTRYREQEEALRESVRLREEVERLSRHDLKTPLNSVIAVSRLLREAGKLSPEDDELLSIVERAGYRILSMVNLSLDLFRMEQGTYQFRPHAIDLGDVARKVAADLESQAASKNVSVRVDVARPAIAHAEELLCYSMLANLLKNAIEASPEGRTVRVTLGGDDESVLAEVHNTGAIPAAMRATFFQKYATSGKSGGLGLGTYSARLMARVQGGDLTMRTSEEKGTTITVRLAASRQPVTSAAAGTPEPAASAGARPAAELPALRVLLVDDDEFNRLVLRRYLPSPPLELAVAVNGRAALDAARKDWPDLVFLDLEMPVMSGYEAARKLRELERAEGRKRAMIVAISSNDDEATIERALASGCDRYLVKPAPREALWQVLAAAGSPPAAASAAVSWPPGGKPAEPRPQDPVEMDADLKANLPAFLASRRRLLEEMPAALQAGERAQFRRLAHRLAGSFALYGFHWAAQQARSLERDAAEGEAADLAARVAAVLEHLGAVEIRFGSAGDPVQVARGG